eukprot:gb/GECH01001724.1/.p1 GENE.gb/GECH01001724.1/~~gb/GECH01001724.1/.p1  ORF type:complete len:218 (+),score=96.07 gb/GECH01001724.1/:1-654(+)
MAKKFNKRPTTSSTLESFEDNFNTLQQRLQDTQSTISNIKERAQRLKKEFAEKKQEEEKKQISSTKPSNQTEENESDVNVSSVAMWMDEQNKLLQQTIDEYETAMSIIIQNSHSKLEKQKEEFELKESVLKDKLDEEKIYNSDISRENVILKEKLQEMASVMRRVASERDDEVAEYEFTISKILRENDALREMNGMKPVERAVVEDVEIVENHDDNN